MSFLLQVIVKIILYLKAHLNKKNEKQRVYHNDKNAIIQESKFQKSTLKYRKMFKIQSSGLP